MQSPHRRLFTRSEAEALLPRVDELLSRATELASKLHEADATSATAAHGSQNGYVHPTPPDPAGPAVRVQLEAVLRELEELGVVVRDLSSGLVDFPAMRQAHVVYLCWRRGEPLRLVWWHELDTGFAGRKPLD